MIVFVCDRNSTLSPMAEAIGRYIAPNIEFQSAGTIQTSIHVRVHSTLRENKISGFALTSKTMWSLDFENMQYVIHIITKTLCLLFLYYLVTHIPSILQGYELSYLGLCYID